jgi:serine/threonine protein kinase
VHRDLKPENVILRDRNSPVLIDFGIALLDRNRKNMAMGGTPFYMAPEQQVGRDIDFRADLYSLGVMTYELLLKKRPTPPEPSMFAVVTSSWTTRSIKQELEASGIDIEIADLVARMLSPHRRWRPESASEVGAVFAAASERASKQTTA